jgi:hypothetical protein
LKNNLYRINSVADKKRLKIGTHVNIGERFVNSGIDCLNIWANPRK